jgi:hypothetical protein
LIIALEFNDTELFALSAVKCSSNSSVKTNLKFFLGCVIVRRSHVSGCDEFAVDVVHVQMFSVYCMHSKCGAVGYLDVVFLGVEIVKTCPPFHVDLRVADFEKTSQTPVLS